MRQCTSDSPSVLILDDWRLQPLNTEAWQDLLEIVAKHYGRRFTIIISPPPVERWNYLIGDSTDANVLLERLVHNAHRIDLAGESVRRVRRAVEKD